MTSNEIRNLDHVVVATPDLSATVAEFEQATGVRPEPGGAHPDRGTRNHLVTFGEGHYLEIIGVDSDQPEPVEQRPFLIDERTHAVVATWAAHPDDIDGKAAAALDAGLNVGPVGDGARRTPSGDLLQWRLTPALTAGRDGAVPFLISWEGSTSPAETVSATAELVSLVVRHPDPQALSAQYALLDVSLPIEQADEPGFTLVIAGPTGQWELS
ncbi:VOC family protein [Aestuariimicrobium ganziense]|uniref:VOC family protein n=1 Tax=Aestuariimicrobium ganziense TaxID=2773677 RepID=UPI00194523E6|nr:VOC family protein [Aestuariimicrobium ganziense]